MHDYYTYYETDESIICPDCYRLDPCKATKRTTNEKVQCNCCCEDIIQDVPDCPEALDKPMTLIEKLKARQRVFVVNLDTGKRFSIEPAYWEGIRLGWTIRNEDGDIAKGYNGIMVEFAVIEDCCAQVVERKTPGVIVRVSAKNEPFQYYHEKCLPEKHKIDGRIVRFADLMDNTACAVCSEDI
jgi:hypothetical protein